MISRGRLFARCGEDGAGSILSDDATMFHPSFERFAPLVQSAEQLTAATGVSPLPAALAPDPHVGPAKTRNAVRRRQSREEGVATLAPNQLAIWLVAE